MNYVMLGLIAGTLTTVAYVPQVYKTIRTRSARDFSLAWLFILSAGLAVWDIYGWLIGSLPLIISDLAGLALVVTILALKLSYRH